MAKQCESGFTRRAFLQRTLGIVGAAGLASTSALETALAAAPPHTPRGTSVSIRKAYSFVYGLMDMYVTGDALRLAQSYVGGFLGSIGFDPAFTYDNSVAIIALLERNTREAIHRAEILGDSLVYAQQHDPAGDGRVRDAYEPNPFIWPDGTPNIAWNWGQGGSATGNQAWAGMALAWLYYRTGERRYLDAAVRLAQWIQTNTYDTRGAGGYTGGVDAGGNSATWKSTEHNIDVYAFFMMLDHLTHDHTWRSRAQHALSLVQAMWSPDNHFWTGTGLDGVSVNPYPIPEDVQTWSYLALRDRRYSASIDWATEHLAVTDGEFVGVSFSNADTSHVWFEGTAHLAAVLLERHQPGDRQLVETYLRTLRLAQTDAPNADGNGIVAASGTLDTGFGFNYYSSLHLGATSWYILAAQESNPFRLKGGRKLGLAR